jgi:hypothetical protein
MSKNNSELFGVVKISVNLSVKKSRNVKEEPNF